MARKSALEKIESHEKLCRIMQKQTFEQIKEMQERIKEIRILDSWRYGSCAFNFINGYDKLTAHTTDQLPLPSFIICKFKVST